MQQTNTQQKGTSQFQRFFGQEACTCIAQYFRRKILGRSAESPRLETDLDFFGEPEVDEFHVTSEKPERK